ncbi:unnamed protein product [Adineta steineri]|uniref:Uncharacterized protein n=1 Tax=Adineta steineri TaxID=433720 RepID=A0A818NP10_9BILA|nr:unnamed protein product [Adineta steineri]
MKSTSICWVLFIFTIAHIVHAKNQLIFGDIVAAKQNAESPSAYADRLVVDPIVAAKPAARGQNLEHNRLVADAIVAAKPNAIGEKMVNVSVL